MTSFDDVINLFFGLKIQKFHFLPDSTGNLLNNICGIIIKFGMEIVGMRGHVYEEF